MKKIWSKKNVIGAILFLIICSRLIYIKGIIINAEAIKETVDGVLWIGEVNADGGISIFPADRYTLAGSVTIPDEIKGYKVTSVEQNAFAGCNKVQEIFIPNTVTKIERSAFDMCTSLKEITIPNSVKTLEDSVFSSDSNLEEVVLPNKLKELPTGTFADCGN